MSLFLFCIINKLICSVFIDSTYKWYHRIFVFLWLTSLITIISRFIHIATNGSISFFYGWIIFHVYMYHIFIQSSVDGHFGCFHVLAIVNSTAVNIRMHASLQIRVFSGYTPRSGITESYGKSIFSFWGHSILFSVMAAPICIPTNSVRVFCFAILNQPEATGSGKGFLQASDTIFPRGLLPNKISRKFWSSWSISWDDEGHPVGGMRMHPYAFSEGNLGS